MEKAIEIVARYHCKQGYFVEVSQEKSVIANRDYWLCKKSSSKKIFLFSAHFENETQEEMLIKERIQEGIQLFEHPECKERTA